MRTCRFCKLGDEHVWEPIEAGAHPLCLENHRLNAPAQAQPKQPRDFYESVWLDLALVLMSALAGLILLLSSSFFFG
jgi:hypothetical protein